MARDSAGNRLPWFKLWTRDFMADPAVQALSWDQRGRYLWALMCSWESESPGTATECQWAEWMGYRWARWGDVRTDFAGLFCPAHDETDGVWTQKRLAAEYVASRSESDRRSTAGKHASAMRWQSERTPAALPSEYERTANGIPSSGSTRSSTRNTRIKTNTSRVKVAFPDPPSWLAATDWRDWTEFRRAIRGVPWTPRAAELTVAKLEKLRGEGHDPASVIRQSIERGWRGLFPLKEPPKNGDSNPYGLPEIVDRWRGLGDPRKVD